MASNESAKVGPIITLKDHLWVHQRTEERAYAIWVSSGCRSGTALRDWLQAEYEVLLEFCRQYRIQSGRIAGQSRCAQEVSFSETRRRPSRFHCGLVSGQGSGIVAAQHRHGRDIV